MYTSKEGTLYAKITVGTRCVGQAKEGRKTDQVEPIKDEESSLDMEQQKVVGHKRNPLERVRVSKYLGT